jgi:hypothetical protein
LTIAIDGIDHAGKSSLARFLAWQLGMPALETDLFLMKGPSVYCCDHASLRKFIMMRHDMQRPVIVEGVFVLRSLRLAGIDPELLIRVESHSEPRQGSWPEEFTAYQREFPRAAASDYRFSW